MNIHVHAHGAMRAHTDARTHIHAHMRTRSVEPKALASAADHAPISMNSMSMPLPCFRQQFAAKQQHLFLTRGHPLQANSNRAAPRGRCLL